MKQLLATVFFAGLLAAGPVWAHGDTDARKKTAPAPHMIEEKPFGRLGDPAKVNRTIMVDMSDKMRFTPAEINVKLGETVRFDVRNSGKVLHEMVLGTMEELKEHHELMKKHPGMEHDEPHMAHVGPGKKQQIVWQFTRPGEFFYGCLIPGHFEAGMIGKVKVAK